MTRFNAFLLCDNHRIRGDCREERSLTFSLTVFAALMLGSQVVTAETLYVADFFDPPSAGRIERVTTDGGVRQVVREVGAGLRGIAVDVSSNSLFWTDVDSDRIERVDLNAPSGASSGVVTTGLDFPQDLDLSGSAGKLFRAEPTPEQVKASNLDGSARSVLFSANTVAIGVDDVNGRIYSEDRSTSSIVRSNFDGREFQEIISDVPIANDIATPSDEDGDHPKRLDQMLARVLHKAGFTGRIERTLRQRLGRQIDPELADLGRLLFSTRSWVYTMTTRAPGAIRPPLVSAIRSRWRSGWTTTTSLARTGSAHATSGAHQWLPIPSFIRP